MTLHIYKKELQEILISLYITNRQEPLYIMVQYSTICGYNTFKAGGQKCCIETKMYRLYRKNDHL